MQYDLSEFKRELEAASGMQAADLILENIRLVDVYTNEIRPASLAIYHGRIIAINPQQNHPAKKRIDGENQFAIPGFIDTHIHIETTLLTPEALSEVIVPWGTTTLFVDAMEIANVAGIDGLLALIKDSDKLPFRIFLEVPSRVPTAPGLETAGAVLGVEEVKTLLKLDETLSLGELDPSKVLGMRVEYLEKILATLESRRICNGHAIGLSPAELNIYAAGHLADDHECVTFEELRDRLRVGICALIREGSSERNTERLMRGVIENGLPTENLMFCTDDKHVNDIVQEGHISYNIQKSIDIGLDPVEAIKMATINAAKHFHVEAMLGSLTPGRYADIVLLEDIRSIKPARVFKGGQLVAENGIAFPAPIKPYPADLFDTVKLSASLSAENFQIPASGKRALCRIITLIPDQIINREEHEWIPIHNEQIEADPGRDILKLSVIERYGKNGHVSTALVRGFGLKKGALASSVSHDHHNIVIVGCNDQDMLFAAKTLRDMKGGFAAVCDGQIVNALPLPLAGLMSILPAREVMERMNQLNEAAYRLGITMAAPFMTLSFISLPTVPELGLTDFGLINVHAHCITNLILQKED